MKNFFKKFRSYSFWISLSGAIILLINALGRAFGFSIENQLVEDIVLSIAGVLVVLGLVTMDFKPNDEEKEENDDEKEE